MNLDLKCGKRTLYNKMVHNPNKEVNELAHRIS